MAHLARCPRNSGAPTSASCHGESFGLIVMLVALLGKHFSFPTNFPWLGQWIVERESGWDTNSPSNLHCRYFVQHSATNWELPILSFGSVPFGE